MQLYRRESARVDAFVRRHFGSDAVVCKAGLDEWLVDATALAARRLGGVWPAPDGAHVFARGAYGAEAAERVPCDDAAARLLLHAAHLGAALRRALCAALQYRVCVGVGSSPSVAKQAAGAFKPDALSVVLADDNAAFLGPLPLRAIAGFGRAMLRKLAPLDVTRCEQLRVMPLEQLADVLGDRAEAETARLIALGADPRPVVASEAKPQTLSAESFVRGVDCARVVFVLVAALAEMLATRLLADRSEHRRVGTQLTVRCRYSMAASDARQRSAVRDSHSMSRTVPSMPSYVDATRPAVARALFDSVSSALQSPGTSPMSEFVAANGQSEPAITIRGLGLAVGNFVDTGTTISGMFGGRKEKTEDGEDDDDDVAEDAMRRVLELPNETDIGELPSFADYSIIATQVRKKSVRAPRTSAALASSDAPTAVASTAVASTATSRKAVASSAASSATAKVVDLLFCKLCPARFETQADLDEHNNWHAAKALSDEWNGTIANKKKSKGTTKKRSGGPGLAAFGFAKKKSV